jgi:hypothetical protein
MRRCARMRSSLSCSMASPCSRSMSLTFSCIPCHGPKGSGTRKALMDSRKTGFIGVSDCFIIFCGCCLSLACRSILMYVVSLFSPSFPQLSPTSPPKLRRRWRLCIFIRAGLVVFSYCEAHFYPAAWTCVPVCWDDVDHVAERIHRVPQLAGDVCLPCCHGRDVRLGLLCAGLCPRCWRRGGNRFLLLGRCVSEGPSIL